MRSNTKSNFDSFMGSNKGLTSCFGGCAVIGAIAGVGVAFAFAPLIGPLSIPLATVAAAIGATAMVATLV